MKPTYETNNIQLYQGDCLEVLKQIPDNYFHAIVTDPPYHLTQISKPRPDQLGKNNPHARRQAQMSSSKGFMGKEWDGGNISFDPCLWAEVLRVLKPGGHCVAFSATRTYHRMACAMEDAGFEVRDMLGWLYGSGMPHGHNISKAIDKAAGAEREVLGKNNITQQSFKSGVVWVGTYDGKRKSLDITAPATKEAKQWDGYNTALKPCQEPIALCRKPLSESTIAKNVLKHGTGALNIDETRVGEECTKIRVMRGGKARVKSQSIGNFTRIETYKTTLGRWPANICHDGSPEVLEVLGSSARFFYSAKANAVDRKGSKHPTVKPIDLIRWLCRLVCPIGGRVLDMFAGTGTTGEAAYREGMECVLIEREEEYIADIIYRLQAATQYVQSRTATPTAQEVMFEGEVTR
jgi:DNA modification methylase